jgi:hypothetical protein
MAKWKITVFSLTLSTLICSTYPYTMYVINLSNILIFKKTKHITRVEIRFNKFIKYSGGDYILNMTSRLFVAVHSFALFTLLTLTCFSSIPMIWRHDKIVRQRRSRAMSRHCGDTTSCIRQSVFFKFKWKCTKC